MRKLFTFAVALLLAVVTSAQVTYYQNFEQEASGWVSDGSWTTERMGYYVSSETVLASYATNEATTNMLTSPEFNVGSVDAGSTMKVKLRALFSNAKILVAVAVDGNVNNPVVVANTAVEMGDWKTLSINLGNFFTQQSLSGSHKIQFLFMLTNSVGAETILLLDDFSILPANTYMAAFSPHAKNVSDTMSARVINDGTFILPECKYTRPHAEFAYWAVADDDTVVMANPTDILSGITSNINVYAVWQHYIAFDANGGSGEMDTMWVESEVSYIAPDATFTREGYTFLGWYTEDSEGSYDLYPSDTFSATEHMTFHAAWGKNPVITFNGNGGSGSMATQYYTYGDTLTMPACTFTAPANYEFWHWDTCADGHGLNIAPGMKMTVRADITFYPIWKSTSAQNMVLHFDANGGQGNMADWIVTSTDTLIVPACGFTMEDMGFYCWAYVDENGDWWRVNPTDTLSGFTSSDTLYAIWGYNITFYANNGTGRSETYVVLPEEESVLPACQFSYLGHTFVGWTDVLPVTDINDVYPAGMSLVFPASMNLAAVWTADSNTITVTFDANGGVGVVPSMRVLPHSQFCFPECGFTKQDKVFAGWALSTTATRYAQPGDVIALDTTADVKFYAIWRDASTFAIHFDGGGAQGRMNDMYVTDQGWVLAPECTFQIEGLTFNYWLYVDGDDAYGVYPGDTLSGFTSDVTLTAMWGYKVTFYANNGTQDFRYMVFEGDLYDEEYTEPLPACMFTRSGYTFVGWCASTSPQLAEDVYPAGAYVQFSGAYTLYAMWTRNENTHQIIFDANGGEGSMDPLNFVPGFNIALPECGFTRQGYIFVGWGAESDAAEDMTSAAGEVLPVPDNITTDLRLFAIWKLDPHSCVDVTVAETLAVCGTSYSWRGRTLTSGGSYNKVVENAVGGECDSIYTLALTFSTTAGRTETYEKCDSYEWHGTTYTESNNTANYRVTGQGGACDTVVTLNLTIHKSTTYTDVQTACESYRWIDGNTYTDNNTTATKTIRNAAGCDSVITLNLVINHGTFTGTQITSSSPYYWEGELRSYSGTYKHEYTNQAGCPSVDTLYLTITQGIENVNTASVKLYPNPTTNSVTITGATVYSVDVMDMTGRKISTVEGTNTVDMTIVGNGVYMMRIETSEGTAVRKVIKR
ncbi:MAG: InlB B-repeat-containing protein [Bacteroidales bacterium]|nr:InlB B-repeat-containing protein [Candidatus Colimorpha onthohippi]